MPWYLILAVALSVSILSVFIFHIFSNGLQQHRVRFTESTQIGLSEVFLFVEPRVLWQATVALAGISALLLGVLTGSVLVGGLAAVSAFALPHSCLRYLSRRRLRQFDRQLPDALQAMAGGLRAGVSIQVALHRILEESPAPLVQEFGILIREQRLGQTLDEGLEKLALRIPTEATQLVVSALRVAIETGGNLAEILERIARMVRSRMQLEGRVQALTAQGKLQAWMVGALPFLLLLVLYPLEPDMMQQLWTTPLGFFFLGALVCLEVVGIWWIRKIVTIQI